MIHLLAIDTSTEALSLALQVEGGRRSLHRLIPRQHQQQLFALIDELCAGRRIGDLSLDAIVYGSGPGSFTGLRIAVSAAQGLAYSLKLPVIGVSSLETQARTLIRREGLTDPCVILSTIDARIGQLYAQAFAFDGSELQALGDAVVAAPDAFALSDVGIEQTRDVLAVGSGCALLGKGASSVLAAGRQWPDLLPEAEDMLTRAAALFAAGETREAAAAIPDYVQTRIGWKTLAEQGRKA